MLRTLRRLSLTHWILIGTVLGGVVGYLDYAVWTGSDLSTVLSPLSTIFLRMIKSIVAPLVFATLVVGVAGHGNDAKKVGRLFVRSISYFIAVTTLALVIGLGAAYLVKPGVGVSLGEPAAGVDKLTSSKPTLTSMLEHTIPTSIVDAMAKNETLQIVFFSLLFAFGLLQVSGKPREFMLDLCESVSQVMFKFTAIVMKFAPIGIAAAVGLTIGKNGLSVVINLGKAVLTLYGALIVLVVAVLLPIAMAARINLRRFWQYVKEPWLLAFTTASSEAALPLALENMEKFGVPRRIVSFVLPTGYSFNLDGSTLYLSVATMFVVQAAGVDMPLGTLITMMLTLLLASKGVAAVPRAALVILASTLTQFDLPLEGVAVLLAVDAFMDMARTSVNLLGNCLASAVMARWEGELEDHPKPQALAA